MNPETEPMADSDKTLSSSHSANGPRSRRANIIQGLVALLVLVVAVFIARSFLQTAPIAGSRPAPEREARLVDVAMPQLQDYQPIITGWGTLMPSRSLSVQAQVSGAVEALSPRLEPGVTVEAGEQLLKLEDLPYLSAVTQAESALAEAEANLALEQGQQAIARREFELLTEDASARGGQSSLGEAENLVLRRPQLRIARAAVEAAEARLAEARLDLERATVKAPFDALVAARSVTLGSQVSVSTELARLVGLKTWWIEVLVGADRLAWLDTSLDGREPAQVQLSHPGVWRPGETRPGYVVRVLQELEAEGNLARVLVGVDDPLALQEDALAGEWEPQLLLGAFMRADIKGRRFSDVFVLEPQWLREGNSVWVMNDDDALEIRPVEVLYRDDNAVLISAGLDAGERVITSRLSTPAEGMPLRTEANTDISTSDGPPPVDRADSDAQATNAGVRAHG